ncbi:MAG: ferredoxin, partial [Oscillospiraceae bacterium]|nr:ferredoxin [Oscillospiraceae bacterium]
KVVPIKVSIDRSGCIGCGLCAESCPEVFRINGEDGLAEVHAQPENKDGEDGAKYAEQNCPVSVITAEEE